MAFPLLFATAVAAAQPALTPSPAVGRPGRPFMSPMGEPVLGAPGKDGLTVWFQQTDRNHDGSITQDEMTADAQRFFAVLDTNHDGEIDPDEIMHYERVIAPEVRTGILMAPQSASDSAEQQRGRTGERGGGGHRGGGRHFRGGGDAGDGFGGDDEASGGRYGLLEIPEPVASADADFNRGVSAQEFQNAAIARFRLLDIDHTGRLTLPELERIRGAASSASRHRESAPVMDPEGDTDSPMPM